MTIENEDEIFVTKIESCFGVITNDSDYRIVTNELGIVPTRFRQKGDKLPSEFSAEIHYARYGLWEISKISIGEIPDLSEHIEYFKNILLESFEAIEKLKKYHKFECVFYVLVNTNDTLGGFELNDKELRFISKISDRFTFRIVTNLKKVDFIQP